MMQSQFRMNEWMNGKVIFIMENSLCVIVSEQNFGAQISVSYTAAVILIDFFLFLNVTLLHTADFFFRSGHRWDIIAVSIVILPSFVVILLGFRIHVPKGTYRSGSLFILIYLLLFTHASNTLAFFATRSSLILYITKYTSIMSYRDLRSM